MVFLQFRNILWEEGGQSFEMILAWLRLVVVLASQLVESSPTSSLLLLLPALHIVRFLFMTTKVLYMSFDKFFLALESRDLSQADQSIIRVPSFQKKTQRGSRTFSDS